MIIVNFFVKENKIKEDVYLPERQELLDLFPKTANFDSKYDAYKQINEWAEKSVYLKHSFFFTCSFSEDGKSVDLDWNNTWRGDFGYLISFSLAEMPTLIVNDFCLNNGM